MMVWPLQDEVLDTSQLGPAGILATAETPAEATIAFMGYSPPPKGQPRVNPTASSRSLQILS